jgi:hypothetical protein
LRKRYYQRTFNLEGELIMRKALLLGGTLVCMLLASGCATPGYSADERGQQIGRNWDFEGKQAIDDFDALMLLRPAGHMTQWAVE